MFTVWWKEDIDDYRGPAPLDNLIIGANVTGTLEISLQHWWFSTYSGASIWRKLSDYSSGTLSFQNVKVDVLGDPDDPSNTFEFDGAPDIQVRDGYLPDAPHPNNGDLINATTLAGGSLRLYGSVLAPLAVTGPNVNVRVDGDVAAPIDWTGVPLDFLTIDGSAIADITLGPDCCNSGYLFIQNLQGTLNLHGDLASGNFLNIGTLAGEALIDGNVDSQIDVGSLPGLLSISGDVSAASNIYTDTLFGQLRIAGDHFGYIYCGTPLWGRILVDGGSSRATGYSIYAADLAASGAISIDNDG
ncbi:MAG: hypothetical protein JNG88_00485 [Phycisphaerales bacterium]|nr:hypothetical protein [Phycisphaerales bacterium]